jgi:hypothetical protein
MYERDEYDLQLDRWARESDMRIGLVLHASRFFVWVTRRILWVLMSVGHGISCVLMRQMEFDADRYEARLSGSRTFESTAVQLRILGLAWQGAQHVLSESWRTRSCSNRRARVRLVGTA